MLGNIWREEWVETVRRDSEDTKYRGQREIKDADEIERPRAQNDKDQTWTILFGN